MDKTACYIHIPFCDHKCIYCDFYSLITLENKDNFLSSITTEIREYASQYSDRKLISSIFFGGGTPSLMEPSLIKRILDEIKNSFSVADDVEITMETNPGTVDYKKLSVFRSIGINRLSVGIQSFDNDDLKFLTRIHDKAIAIKTIEFAVDAGFTNINIDLIFNLPNQTLNKWDKNLKIALKLPVQHISAYNLIIERGTILNGLVKKGEVSINDNDFSAGLYEHTIERLTANGFVQYEVSNFSHEGFECKHNVAYWDYSDYFGFGPSAHSFIDGKRSWHVSSLKMYIHSILEKKNAKVGSEVLSLSQMEDEFIMLALRSTGLNLKYFSEKFGNRWEEKNNVYIKNLIDSLILTKKNDILSFTAKGYALCDEILANFK